MYLIPGFGFRTEVRKSRMKPSGIAAASSTSLDTRPNSSGERGISNLAATRERRFAWSSSFSLAISEGFSSRHSIVRMRLSKPLTASCKSFWLYGTISQGIVSYGPLVLVLCDFATILPVSIMSSHALKTTSRGSHSTRPLVVMKESKISLWRMDLDIS